MTAANPVRAMVALLAAALAVPAAAQGNRPWVDPPSQSDPAPQNPEPAQPPAAAPEPLPAPALPASPEPRPTKESETPPARNPPEGGTAESPERGPREAIRPPPGAEPGAPARPRAPPPRRTEDAVRPPRPERSERRSREPSPETAARPSPRSGTAAEDVAARFAVEYLAFWSAPNAVTLDTIPDFYAPSVRYHGRRMTAREVFGEKLRFVRRWPQRRYTPRMDTMRVSCAGAAPFCTVRTAFDFIASNPDRGTTSAGLGSLELGVSLGGERPLIVEERSGVSRRGRPGPRFEAIDGQR